MGLGQSGCWCFGCCNAGHDNTRFVAHISGAYCSDPRRKTVPSSRIALVFKTCQSDMRTYMEGTRKMERVMSAIQKCWLLFYRESAEKSNLVNLCTNECPAALPNFWSDGCCVSLCFDVVSGSEHMLPVSCVYLN